MEEYKQACFFCIKGGAARISGGGNLDDLCRARAIRGQCGQAVGKQPMWLRTAAALPPITAHRPAHISANLR